MDVLSSNQPSSSMSGPITTSILISIAGGLAKDAVVWGWQKAEKAGLIPDIREAIGREQLHPKIEQVFKQAIQEASRELRHLDGPAVEAFFKAAENRRIVSQWFWEPGLADLQKSRFDFSGATSRQEQSNLEHFIGRLPAAIERNTQKIFDDESRLVIERVSSTIRREGKMTRSAIESARTDISDRIEEEGSRNRDHVDARFDKVERLVTEMQASGGEGTLDRVEATLRDDLDEVKQFIDRHQIRQALELGKRTLRKIEDEDLSPEARRTAHEHLANAYLSTLDRREEAIPHVEALAVLATNDLARLRNQALAAHLRGETKRGLELVDEALTENPDDRTSLLVKANLLAEMAREDEAVDLYAKHVDPKSASDLHNLAQMEIRAGRHEKAVTRAEAGLEIEPENPNLHFLLGMAATLAHNEKIERGRPALTEEENERLRQALSHLDKATKGYKNNPSRQSAAYFYRGIIALWFGEFDSAERAFERAYELTPTDSATLHNLTLLALRRDDGKNARRHLERLKRTDHDVAHTEMLFMESRILQREGDAEGAVRLLEKVAKEEASEDDEVVDLQILLARAHRENFDVEKAERIMEELRETYPDDPRLLIEEAQLASQSGNLDEAIEKFRQAQTKVTGRRTARVKAALANVLFNRARETGSEKDYEEALELYRERLVEHSYDLALWREAICLLRLGRYKECMEHCEAAQEEKPRPQLKKIQARIHELHENYAEAAELYKEIALQSGTDVDALLHCSQCYAMIGEAGKTLGAAEKVAGQIDETSARDQLLLSRAYLENQDMERAVRHAYLAQKHGGDEQLYAENYLWLFLTYSKEIKATDAARSEHHEAYRRLIIEYPERFPDSKFLQRFEVPDDPEELIEQIRKQLPAPEEVRAKKEILATKRLPIGAVARLLGDSVAKAWALLIQNPQYEVAADEGPRTILDREREVAIEADAIMLDLVPLLTLDELGLLGMLPQAFEEIYIAQAAFDELQEAIQRERPVEGEPRRFIRPNINSEEGIAIEEISPARPDAFVQRLRRARDFIRQTDKVKPVGRSIGREERPEAIQVAADDAQEEEHIEFYYDEVLGRPAAEALREAPLQGLILYTEDALLRRFARSEDSEAFGHEGAPVGTSRKGNHTPLCLSCSDGAPHRNGIWIPVRRCTNSQACN